MASVTSGLPSRFPVGTKFVIEGCPGGKGRVFRRYVEFPDGTRVRLPRQAEQAKQAKTAKTAPASSERRPRRARPRRA